MASLQKSVSSKRELRVSLVRELFSGVESGRKLSAEKPGPPSFPGGGGALMDIQNLPAAVWQVHHGDVQSEPALFAVERSVRTEEENCPQHSGNSRVPAV
jgi:hypothetical protein